MSDLIDRQKAVDAVLDLSEKISSEMLFIDAIVDEIENVPSIEPERERGKWRHLGGDEWCCTNCGYIVFTEGSWEHPKERGKDYCEHCGADMKRGGGKWRIS